MTKVMKTMVDRMRSSNKIFTEFEDKRLKFKKVQYRKEECEFQLKMIQMLQQGMGTSNFYITSIGTTRFVLWSLWPWIQSQ